MTTYQSQTVYTVDREGNSLAFSTVNEDAEEAVLKARVDIELPDGQQVQMNVLYTGDDVRELLAYLHDNFGGRGKTAVPVTDVQQAGSVIGVLPDGQLAVPANLDYYVDEGGMAAAAWQPKPGDTVHVVTATVNDHQTGVVGEPSINQFGGPAPGQQCAVIYDGVRCDLEGGHQSQHYFPFPQNDAGAATPPADVQGATNTPQPVAAGTAEAAPASQHPEQGPPRRKRRMKVEKAYDDALAAYNAEPTAENNAAFQQTVAALRAKDPGNSRLAESTELQQVPEGQPGTPVGFAPEQPIANPFEQPAAGPWTQRPDGAAEFNVLAAAAQAPAFQPGQAPELGQVQISAEESAAAGAFPCPVQSSDGRACQRPYGHELQTATNPQPKPHVYATADPALPGQPPMQPQVTDPLPWDPAQGGPAFAPGQFEMNGLSFQVPPTPEAAAPHPETNIQPPAPAAPSWQQPVWQQPV